VRLMAQICDKEVVALMKHRLLTRGCIFLRLHTQRLHHEEQPSQSGALSNQMVLARKVWLLLSQTYLWHAPAGTTTRNKLREVAATYLDDNKKSLENSVVRKQMDFSNFLQMAYAVVAAFLLTFIYGSLRPMRTTAPVYNEICDSCSPKKAAECSYCEWP
ncbi:hypothetical protein GCK32_017608, partial [Trichostrongylus colubriformis]